LRYFRLLLIFLVCLPQVFAPLLHAHAGGETSRTPFHLPGLESWDSTEPAAVPASCQNQQDGIVVGLSQGVRYKAVLCKPPQALPAASFPMAVHYGSPGVCCFPAYHVSPLDINLFSQPRAPPA